jgi:5'(3')-deoxyribonucleotidase
MDDTMVFLMKAIHADHNKKFPEHQISYEQMKAFEYDMFHPDYDCLAFMKEEPEIFFNLELVDEYVIPEIKKMNEEFDVIIVTSAFAEVVLDKWRWMEKHLPFIPHRNFITTARKDLVNADILIDDAIHNIKDWVASGRTAIVPRHHWNHELANLPLVVMFDGWEGMCERVSNLVQMMEFVYE